MLEVAREFAEGRDDVLGAPGSLCAKRAVFQSGSLKKPDRLRRPCNEVDTIFEMPGAAS